MFLDGRLPQEGSHNTVPIRWWGRMESRGRIIRLWRREEKVNVSVWIAPLK